MAEHKIPRDIPAPYNRDSLSEDYHLLFDDILFNVTVAGRKNQKNKPIFLPQDSAGKLIPELENESEKYDTNYFYDFVRHVPIGTAKFGELVTNYAGISSSKWTKMKDDGLSTVQQAEKVFCLSAFLAGQNITERLASYIRYAEEPIAAYYPKVQLYGTKRFENEVKALLKTTKTADYDNNRGETNEDHPLEEQLLSLSLQLVANANGDSSYKISTGQGTDSLTIDNKKKELDSDRVSHQLSWEYRLTKFEGRETELAQLKDWLNQTPSKVPVSIKLIHGEGGVGKTRLAYHFADKCIENDWTAGAMGENKDQNFVGEWQYGEKGILLIIDYPEEHKYDTELFMRALHGSFTPPEGKAIRVLLLSRSHDVSNRIIGAKDGRVDKAPIHLTGFKELGSEIGSAWKTFRSAWRNINKHLPSERDNEPISEEEFDKWMKRGKQPNNDIQQDDIEFHIDEQDGLEKENIHTTPLIIIALASYLSDKANYIDKTILDIEARDLIRKLTIKEAKRLEDEVKKSPENKNTDYKGVLLIRAVAAIANGLSAKGIQSIKAALEEEKVNVELPNINELKALSPWNREKGKFLPVKPHILAADFLAYCLGEYAEAEEAAWVFAGIGMQSIGSINVDNQRISDNFSRLDRLIYDTGHKLKVSPHWPVENLPLYLIECDSSYSRWIADNLNGVGMGLHMIPVEYLALRCAAELDKKKLVENPALNGPPLANKLGKLSVKLSEAGFRDDALKASELAASIMDTLVVLDPERFLIGSTLTLYNLSLRLREACRIEDALETGERAFEIYYELVNNKNLPRFEGELAMSLVNLSRCLSKAGRLDDAFTAAQDAVQKYSDLVDKSDGRYGTGFATSLDNLSRRSRELGMNERALVASELAQNIWEFNVQENPSYYRSYLALSLDNRSRCLFEGGQKDEALETINRAIHFLEGLEHVSFPAYGAHLGNALLFHCCYFDFQIETLLRVTDIYFRVRDDNCDLWVTQYPQTVTELLAHHVDFVDLETARIIRLIHKEVSNIN